MNGSTFRYQTKDGPRWGYVVETGRDDAGRRKQARRRGFPDEAAARAALHADLTDRRRGVHVDPSRQPLAAYLAEWLEATAPSRSDHTNAAYASIVRVRIVPELGGVPIGRLAAPDVQRFVNRLAARYAPKTVRLTHLVLNQALDKAVSWRMLPHNPAKGAALPKPTPKDDDGPAAAWSAAEAKRFLDAVAGDRDEALWRLMLDGQLRIGEALALRWSDLAPAADGGAVVSVARTLTKDADGRWRVGETTKGKRARRVSVSPATAAALRAHEIREKERALAFGQGWSTRRLVFCRDDGAFVYPSTPRARFDRVVAAAGLPPISPHGLRHTGATLLVLAGIPLKVVSERLGHAGIAITADVYSHVTDEADRAAADVLARLIDAS